VREGGGGKRKRLSYDDDDDVKSLACKTLVDVVIESGNRALLLLVIFIFFFFEFKMFSSPMSSQMWKSYELLKGEPLLSLLYFFWGGLVSLALDLERISKGSVFDALASCNWISCCLHPSSLSLASSFELSKLLSSSSFLTRGLYTRSVCKRSRVSASYLLAWLSHVTSAQ
jgi:hypothetical protein